MNLIAVHISDGVLAWPWLYYGFGAAACPLFLASGIRDEFLASASYRGVLHLGPDSLRASPCIAVERRSASFWGDGRLAIFVGLLLQRY